MDTRFLSRTIIAGFSILLLTLSYFQISQGDYYIHKAENNYIKIIPSPSLRGSIFDSEGTLLAQDRPSFHIAVIPYQIRKEKEALFGEISDFLHREKKDLDILYKRNFQNIFSPVDILVDLNKKDALRIK